MDAVDRQIGEAADTPVPALYGVILCAVLMISAGAWSWSHRDPGRTRTVAENWALGLAIVLICAALWAALLQPWPHVR